MRFWTLEDPGYDSDYRSAYVNGSLEHPFALPGVVCDVCGQTWGGSRILPYECPFGLRERKQLRSGWPIPLSEHRALREEARSALMAEGYEPGPLRPGDSFQPAYLDVPSRPMHDFLWSSIGSVVVSGRVRELLSSCGADSVAFCPVTPRKIGDKDAAHEPPMPASGEPEDIVEEVPLLSELGTVRPYYELILLSESGRPPGGEPESTCFGCGRESIDDNKRVLIMQPSMWRGASIFFLATTLYMIITEDLRQKLEAIQATNVAFGTCEAA